MEGKIEERRPRGKSLYRWADQMKTIIDHGLHQATEEANDRETEEDYLLYAQIQI